MNSFIQPYASLVGVRCVFFKTLEFRLLLKRPQFLHKIIWSEQKRTKQRKPLYTAIYTGQKL